MCNEITTKMYLKIIALSIILIISTVNCEYKSYKDFKLYKVVANTAEDVKFLDNIKNGGIYQFWSDIILNGNGNRVMVSAEQSNEFITLMKNAGIHTEVVMEDVQKTIEAQMERPTNTSRVSSIGQMTWEYYHTVQEIYDWLDAVAAAYPNIVTIVNMGKSYGGINIKGIEINFRHEDNPVIGMFEGGIHAREWVSPATVTWIINEFLTSDDEDIKFLARNVVWHLFPVTNPDGYIYSFTNDRMWRKTRNPTYATECPPGVSDDSSNGVDLNRNFGFLWMEIGASSDPCSFTYAGPEAFSEPESKAIRDYVLELKTKGRFMYYFSMHSFSEMVLVPYSHVAGIDVLEVKNYADMYEIAIRGMDKLEKRYGTKYRVGTSKQILYDVTGTSFDWVKEAAGVPIVYCFELRDDGTYGFLLPPELMRESNLEVMDSLIEMDKIARHMNYYEGKSSATNAVLSIASLIITLFVQLLK